MPDASSLQAPGPSAIPRTAADMCHGNSTHHPTSARTSVGKPRSGAVHVTDAAGPQANPPMSGPWPWPVSWLASWGPGPETSPSQHTPNRSSGVHHKRRRFTNVHRQRRRPGGDAPLDGVKRPLGLLEPRGRQAADARTSGGSHSTASRRINRRHLTGAAASDGIRIREQQDPTKPRTNACPRKSYQRQA